MIISQLELRPPVGGKEKAGITSLNTTLGKSPFLSNILLEIVTKANTLCSTEHFPPPGLWTVEKKDFI